MRERGSGGEGLREAGAVAGPAHALDATFYLLDGFVNDKPWQADIMLNLPHVVVSTVMLAAAYGIRPSERARERTPDLA